MVLLLARLSFPVEQHHVVCPALEEVVAISGIGIPAVARILQDVHTFMV